LSFCLSLFLSHTLPFCLSLLSLHSLDCFSFLLSPIFLSCSLSFPTKKSSAASCLSPPRTSKQTTTHTLTTHTPLLLRFSSSSTPSFQFSPPRLSPRLYSPVCCVHFHSLFLAVYVRIIGRIKNDSICLVFAVRFFVHMHPRAASTHIYIK